MTEEKVTKAILGFLMGRGWRIISFDFPQSGTGRSLHPCGSASKNDGVLIPDVVAVKNGVSIYLENKDHFSPDDFAKVGRVLRTKIYADAFLKVLGINQDTMLGGIGLPDACCELIREESKSVVDFVLKVSEEGSVSVFHKAPGLVVDF